MEVCIMKNANQLSFLKNTQPKETNNIYDTMLKERLSSYGVATLQDAELMSLLSGIPLVIMKKHLDAYGLIDLIKNLDALDITPTQKRKLSLLYSFCHRVSIFPIPEKTKIDSSAAAGNFFVEDMKWEVVELFKVMLLNNQNQIISVDLAIRGTVNEAAVYVREIIKNALNKNAVSLIFCHNHPSGNPKASSADIHLTKQLKAACNTVKIQVLDHIIVCPNGQFTSMAELDLL